MTLRDQILRRRRKHGGSWATLGGLLTASVATMIGMVVGLEPDVILWRAFASGLLMTFLISFGISVIDAANATS